MRQNIWNTKELIELGIGDPNYIHKIPTVPTHQNFYTYDGPGPKTAVATLPPLKKEPKKRPAEIRQVRSANGTLGYICEQESKDKQTPGYRQVRLPDGNIEYTIEQEDSTQDL